MKNEKLEKTYVLREKGTGQILLEPDFHNNGYVINIITDRKLIESKHKMYYRKDYYIDELILTD